VGPPRPSGPVGSAGGGFGSATIGSVTIGFGGSAGVSTCGGGSTCDGGGTTTGGCAGAITGDGVGVSFATQITVPAAIADAARMTTGQYRRRRGTGCGGNVAAEASADRTGTNVAPGIGVRVRSRHDSSAARVAAADWNRSAGSFSSKRPTIVARLAGTPVIGGARSLPWAAISS